MTSEDIEAEASAEQHTCRDINLNGFTRYENAGVFAAAKGEGLARSLSCLHERDSAAQEPAISETANHFMQRNKRPPGSSSDAFDISHLHMCIGCSATARQLKSSAPCACMFAREV